MLTPNPNLYIPRVFTDRDGVQHRADSWDALIQKVITYRLRNKIPAGDPETEVFDQVCKIYPDKCQGKGGKRPWRSSLSLNKRILAWVVGLIDRVGDLLYVSDDERSRRAQICSSCPHQKEWRASCKGCTRDVTDAVKALLQGRGLSDLRGCDVLGEDLRLSTWLVAPEVENEHLPAHCWRKR